MKAYEACLAETSSKHAPLVRRPGHDKPNARLIVSRVIVDALEELDMSYPEPDARAGASCRRSAGGSSNEATLSPCLNRRAASSTWTWTRSMRRSSSATTLSCGGRPVAVGGPAQVARRGGRRRATKRARSRALGHPDARALRLCPSLVVVRPDFARYRAVSQQVMTILRSATPLVEPLSLDEAYLDVTDNLWASRSRATWRRN